MIEELERLLTEHAKITAEEEVLRQEYCALPSTAELPRMYSPMGQVILRRLRELSDAEEANTRPRIEEEIAELVIANRDHILAALKDYKPPLTIMGMPVVFRRNLNLKGPVGITFGKFADLGKSSPESGGNDQQISPNIPDWPSVMYE